MLPLGLIAISTEPCKTSGIAFYHFGLVVPVEKPKRFNSPLKTTLLYNDTKLSLAYPGIMVPQNHRNKSHLIPGTYGQCFKTIPPHKQVHFSKNMSYFPKNPGAFTFVLHPFLFLS